MNNTQAMKSQQPAMLKARLESQEAFKNAITAGRLSRDENVCNYAGHYMFMGCECGRDLFKNICTRRYDV
jgi:hypothetical protein